MKLFYVANNQLPTRKAHGLQIAKMCEAFSHEGADVELIIPRRPLDPEIQEEDIFRFYGLRSRFRVHYLWSFGFVFHSWRGEYVNRFLFWVQQASFAWSVRRYLRHATGIVYSRDPFVLASLRGANLKLHWEIHSLPERISSRPYSDVLRSCTAIWAISGELVRRIRALTETPVHLVPDGYEPEDFSGIGTRADSRALLDLPRSMHIALYAGHLYEWKGADTFAASARYLPDGYLAVIVGGDGEDVMRFKYMYPYANLRILGYVPHREVGAFLRAADVLVLPNSGKQDISRLYTSPLKLFEYMASGTPIIASDLPSLRDILNDTNAYFIPPDDPQALAHGIQTVLNDEQAPVRAVRAQEDVRKYSWRLRARNILSGISD